MKEVTKTRFKKYSITTSHKKNYQSSMKRIAKTHLYYSSGAPSTEVRTIKRIYWCSSPSRSGQPRPAEAPDEAPPGKNSNTYTMSSHSVRFSSDPWRPRRLQWEAERICSVTLKTDFTNTIQRNLALHCPRPVRTRHPATDDNKVTSFPYSLV